MADSGINLNNGFWRNRLSDEDRADYDRVLSEFERRGVFGIRGLRGSGDKLANTVSSVLWDNPQLYYAYTYNLKQATAANGTVTLTPNYLSCNDKRFNKAVDEILSKAPQTDDEYVKVLFVKDYLADNVLYDHDVVKQVDKLQNSDGSYNSGKIDSPQSFTAYGAIVNRRATCDGITGAACYLLRKLGVQCVTVTGKSVSSGENHSWAYVRVNGEVYHLDITGDLLQSAFYFERTYHFFLNTDDEHSAYFTPNYPDALKCTSYKDSYYMRNGLQFDNFEKLRRYLVDGAYGGRVEFKYVGGCSPKTIETLLNNAVRRNVNSDKLYVTQAFSVGRYFALIKSKYLTPKRQQRS